MSVSSYITFCVIVRPLRLVNAQYTVLLFAMFMPELHFCFSHTLMPLSLFISLSHSNSPLSFFLSPSIAS